MVVSESFRCLGFTYDVVTETPRSAATEAGLSTVRASQQARPSSPSQKPSDSSSNSRKRPHGLLDKTPRSHELTMELEPAPTPRATVGSGLGSVSRSL